VGQVGGSSSHRWSSTNTSVYSQPSPGDPVRALGVGDEEIVGIELRVRCSRGDQLPPGLGRAARRF